MRTARKRMAINGITLLIEVSREPDIREEVVVYTEVENVNGKCLLTSCTSTIEVAREDISD